jgi:hypothetical protein
MRQAMLVLFALIVSAGLAQAQDVPKRKSGLWEVKRTTVRTGEKARVVQMCIDEASDNAVRQLAEGMRNESCKTTKLTREGDKMTVDAVCNLGQTKVTSTTHAVITGKFDSAYKIESTSKYDPPMYGRAEGGSTLEGRWLGACKPDQKPGDYILPNGVKLRASDPEKVAADKAAAAQAQKAGTDAKAAKQKRKGNFMPAPASPAAPAPAAPAPPAPSPAK